MSEFNELQNNLDQKRNRTRTLRRDLFLSKERLQQVRAKEASLNRFYDSQNPQHAALKKRLEAQKQRLTGEINQWKTTLEQEDALEWADWQAFFPYTDPREHIGQLDDNYPILLLPLRLETRFKTVTDQSGSTVEQLWVRVFPDDCAIDTFEPVLSESEVRSAQDFWIAWWKAAGQKSGQRGAWRSLVASHGSGRGAWILKEYRPINEESEPKRENSEDVILVVPSESPLPDTEKAAVATFWEAIWRANGDNQQQKEALSALETRVGAERVQIIVEQYRPASLEDPYPFSQDRSAVTVHVAFLEFPSSDELDTQRQTWSTPPTVWVLPERFVLLGYRKGKLEVPELGAPIPFPLVVGPNPLAEPEDQIQLLDGDLKVSEGMRWMVDFEEAVAKGMGFKIDLSPDQAENGFDRLMVVGVRLSADKDKGKKLFEELIQHHHEGNSGFSFLPVGTPTNNTLDAKSGFSASEDPDESFDLIFGEEEPTTDPEISTWWTKKDRFWLAEMLGVSAGIFERVPWADGRDQCEARAMNVALWPATWGYFFESMMQPLFEEREIEHLRWFFNHFVVGRGIIPSIRIDDQPYGILPTTVFSRMNWLQDPEFPMPLGINHPRGIRHFLLDLYGMLKKIHEDWKEMFKEVSYIGKEGDPHQILLDVLGLHGGSVEFHQRYAESLNHIFNLYNLGNARSRSRKVVSSQNLFRTSQGLFPSASSIGIEQVWKALFNELAGKDLLRELEYEGEEWPEILEKLFVLTPNELTGPLIDDQILSETNPIRPYILEPDPKNYIRWLIDAAQISLEVIRKEEGFTDNIRPNALLYLMLKHAVELGYWDAGLQLYEVNRVFDSQTLRTARIEPDFIHVRERKDEIAPQPEGELLSGKPLDYPMASESKYHLLYRSEPGITNEDNLLVAEYIPQVIKTDFATRYLWEQIKALRHLENTPTARLERAFVEHLDCASYRFDAWKAGLVNLQLAAMRYRERRGEDDSVVPTQGLYLGAYGWLENVRSENKALSKVSLEGELADIFKKKEGQSPVMRDDSNAGFIHAPSLTHAVTAAVLRNGYLSNATSENPDILSINLSSERVRLALSVLEGIRNGQSLPALLGYQFERGLHDRNDEANVDQYILKIRRKFPLVGNRMQTTKEADENISIDAIEARNVVHGLDMIEFVEERIDPNDPFSYFQDLGMDGVSPSAKTVIAQEIDRIRDINDAVADLGMAESVHQIVQGNIDRAAGTLDTYSKGHVPQVPDVIQTPRSGVNLTHRVGLQMEANAAPDTPLPGYDPPHTPRALAEPAMNKLLFDLLPNLNLIFCTASFYHAASNTYVEDFAVSLGSLGLHPIDLLYMVNTDTDQVMSALDDRVVHYIKTKYPDPDSPLPPRPDALISIKYYIEGNDTLSVFELAPLIRHLRALLLRSRPLRPGDIILAQEADKQNDLRITLDERRITLVQDHLQSQNVLLDQYITDLDDLIKSENEAMVIANIDTQISQLVEILLAIGVTGLPQTGTGFSYDWLRVQFEHLFEKFNFLKNRWEDKLDQFKDLMNQYEPGTVEEKFELLTRAERLVSTQPTLDPGSDPDTFKVIVLGKKDAFELKKESFDQFLDGNHQQLSTALNTAETLLSYEAFDLVPTEIEDIKAAIQIFTQDLLKRATQLQDDLATRLTKATDLLSKHGQQSNPQKKAQILMDAGKVLLSEDFKLIPSFTLTEDQANEWQAALGHQDELLSYLTGMLHKPLPVDEWFYGVARVREKMGHFEQMILLSEGFSENEVDLTPVQFPYREPYRWLAMEFDVDDEKLGKVLLENDHLLYTAYYHQPPFDETQLDKPQQQCGLLLDEWTEVIPTEEETTGITFHYDRPNSEPPQTMLLVTPPQFEEKWRWQDLVDALHETLEEAKLRAVEPEQIDRTGYANFLPATISAVTRHPVSIMMNYAFNNQLSNYFETQEDHE